MDDASDSIIAIVRALILAAPPGHLPQVVAHLAEVVNDDELLGDVYPPLCLEYLQQHGAVLLLPVSRLKGPSFAALTPAPGHNYVRIVASNLTSLATWIRRIAELPDVERARYLGMDAGGANEGDGALVWSLLDPEAQLAEEVEAYFHDRRCIDVGEDEVRYDVEACAGCTSGDAQEEESGNLFADLVECFGFEHLDSVFFSLRDGIYVEVDPVEGRCLRVIPFASHEEGSGSSSLPLPPILRCIETQRFANVGMPLLPSPSSAEAVLQTYAEERFGTGGKTAGSFPRRATFLPVHSPEEANDGDDLPKAVARQFAERRQCDAATAVVAYPSTSTHDEGATSGPALSMSLVAAWTRPGLGWTARWHSDYRLAVGPEIRTSLQGATSVHIFFSDATPHPEALSGLPTDHSTSMHYTTSLDLVATPVRDENGASPSLPLWLDVLATHERRVQDELTRTVSSTQRNLLAPMWPSRMDGYLANLRRETPVVGSSFPVTTKVAE